MANRIAIVGAGLMGHGIAQIFATGGYDTRVYDLSPGALATVKERIRSNLTLMAEYGLVGLKDIPTILERIEICEALEEVCIEADVVIETVIEDMRIKQDLFARLDELCNPDTILCSGTSVMSITQIAEKASHRGRILGTHFWNPPYLIPLVEVIRTQETAEQCMQTIYALMEEVGKKPVLVNKDVPGFIANRMQHALWREAFAIIDEGICDAETVDIAVRNSFGMRLSVLGPVINADLIGLDLTKAIHDYILPHINASPSPSVSLREKVAANELGFKTGSGFLEWTPEKMTAVRTQLLSYLMKEISQTKK